MQSKPDWEKRFDEEFYYCPAAESDNRYSVIKDRDDFCPAGIDQIKDFITQELERQRREYVEAVEELAYKAGKLDAYAQVNDLTKTRIVASDVLAILKKAREL